MASSTLTPRLKQIKNPLSLSQSVIKINPDSDGKDLARLVKFSQNTDAKQSMGKKFYRPF